MNIASFTKRIWAYIIDNLLLIIPLGVCLFFLYLLIPEMKDVPIYFIVFGFIFAHWLIYFLFIGFYMFLSNGRTIGNLIFGLRIIHPDISRLSLGDCFARSACQGIIIFPIISMLFVITIRSEKSVFDRMTNTVVADWRNKVL